MEQTDLFVERINFSLERPESVLNEMTAILSDALFTIAAQFKITKLVEYTYIKGYFII